VGSSPAPVGAPEILERVDGEGRLSYAIPTVDTAVYNRRGLVIVRVDADEATDATDATGAYTLVLHEPATE
jgi:hypothetical protein